MTMSLPASVAGANDVWSFEQLGAKRKRISLPGKYAPLGRPRHGTVVKNSLKIANETVYYSGDTEPTRHEFGRRLEPIDLNGRWSDRYLGSGAADAMNEVMRSFVDDRQEVLITWGNILSLGGFVDQFDSTHEGRGEVVWSMHIQIDRDNFLLVTPELISSKRPKEYIGEIIAALRLVDVDFSKQPRIKGSVLDLLNGLLASLNSVSSSLLSVAGQIDSLANAPFAALRSLRATNRQFRTVLVRLHTTYDDLLANAALETERAEDIQTFLGIRAEFSAGQYQALRTAAELDRQTVLAERGQTLALYTARGGDTWESIARNKAGSAEKADAIRQANGIDAGQPPLEGATYRIPK
jgi:hypothetical protein